MTGVAGPLLSLSAGCVALAGPPAMADGRYCEVQTRCHNALPCQAAGFDLRLELEGDRWVMTTVSDGGRTVFDRAWGDRNTALFLEGEDRSDHGTAHMLASLHNEVTLFLSVHNATATPVVETFIGTCGVIE